LETLLAAACEKCVLDAWQRELVSTKNSVYTLNTRFENKQLNLYVGNGLACVNQDFNNASGDNYRSALAN